MSVPVTMRVIVTTDDESPDAAARIESTVRRALGQWIDPLRVYVEAIPKETT